MGVTYHDCLTGRTRHITDAEFEAMPRSGESVEELLTALVENTRAMEALMAPGAVWRCRRWIAKAVAKAARKQAKETGDAH